MSIKNARRIRRFFLACLVIAVTGCSAGTNYIQRDNRHAFEPWSTDVRHPTMEEVENKHHARNGSVFDEAFKIYARFITKIDDARCEHHPTCSRYARDAMRKHGVVLGSFMAIDRLVRGSRSSVLRDLKLYKVENGKPYFEDPIENNDFFF